MTKRTEYDGSTKLKAKRKKKDDRIPMMMCVPSCFEWSTDIAATVDSNGDVYLYGFTTTKRKRAWGMRQ